jgi:hypothetical protein
VGASAGTGGFLCDPTYGGLVGVNSLLSVDDAGWAVTTAEDINNLGQIVGTATQDGMTRPVFPNPPSLPNTCGELRFSAPRALLFALYSSLPTVRLHPLVVTVQSEGQVG